MLCTSQIEASTSPPPHGQTLGHLNFCKIFVQIPPSRVRKAVQMPHYRSIPGDQMPPPPGKLFGSFYYAPEAVYVNMVYRQHSYMPKIIQIRNGS